MNMPYTTPLSMKIVLIAMGSYISQLAFFPIHPCFWLNLITLNNEYMPCRSPFLFLDRS